MKDHELEFKELINNLNDYLEEPYKFQLDKLYSTPRFKGDTMFFIKYQDSIIKDKTIVPKGLTDKILKSNFNQDIVKWINRKIFTIILEDLLERKFTEFKTKVVRLRIASNLAVNNAILLTKDEKIKWEDHIKNVFYNRNLAISNYYSQVICELPF